jgi:DNA-binding transcriptional ArsR family regulator
MPGAEYVEERDIVARPLRVAAAPIHSLLMATRDAAGAERAGTPEAWRRVIRAHLTRSDYEVLAPLSTPRPTLVPSALVPFPRERSQSVKNALERIVADDTLAADIDECMGTDADGDWREPARDPRRWVRGLALAMTRAWAGFRPIWQAGQGQIAAEAERIAAASDRARHLEVLGDLVPCAHVSDGRWMLEWPVATSARLAVPEQGLTLVPLVAGSRASIVDADGATVKLVGYPLRPRRCDATLEALLGIPRARILRELDMPATNNRLAAALQAVPSAATHHVSALVAAGLVERDRSNGSLLVRRTTRGDALLALYERA